MRKLFVLLACLSGAQLCAQLLTPDQARTDIDSVISVLSDIHPTFNETSNKNELLLLRDTLDTALTCHELFKLLQPLVALDGHTTLQFTGAIQPQVENPLLPAETVIYDNRLYVKHNLSTDTLLKKGTEILMINGTPVSDIIGKLLTFLPGERPEYKIRKLDNAAFPNWYRLLYGNNETFEIGYALEGDIRTTIVKGVHRNSFSGHEEDLLKLSFTEPGIACLKIGRFTHPREFLPFIDSAFTEIQRRHCDQLIIEMNKEDVIHPDFKVPMTLDDLLNDSDAYLDFTIGKISSQHEIPARVLKGHEWSVTALDINKKGDMLLSGSWDNTMILWDLNHDSILGQFGDHTNMIWEVAFSHDEKYVASASWDASINVWDLDSRALAYKLSQAPKFTTTQTEPYLRVTSAPNMVNTIAFSPDGRFLASGSSDGIIRIWDLSTGDLSDALNIHESTSVNCLLFDASGARLISGSDRIRIHNLKTGKTEMTLDGHHRQYIGSLDMDHSGHFLISGDIATRNPLIILWDLDSGEMIRAYKGHRSVIRDIAFSNNDAMIASVGEDNLVNIWSVQTGDPIKTFSDHDEKELNAVCFSRDDQMIIYGSQDKTIKFRELGSHE